jgi:hypothetical protein
LSGFIYSGKRQLADPRRWTSDELESMAREATEHFRRDRGSEPGVVYSNFFEAFVPVFGDLIDNKLPRLAATENAVDQKLLASIVADVQARIAFRYLAAPPISDDDLKTLAESTLSARALRTDADQAERVREVVLNALDPHRFPWVGVDRSPSDREREIAIVASAVLVATQRVGTRRRSNAKREQEQVVRQLLTDMGLIEIPRREIPLLEDGPLPGQFCGESKLGDTRADLVVRLPDRRYLAVECKVSNSAVNSFKRVNHEALGKAAKWLNQFGTRAVVPAAVLAGVFNPSNLQAAQEGGLFLVWSHQLDDLRTFIASCISTAATPRRRR